MLSGFISGALMMTTAAYAPTMSTITRNIHAKRRTSFFTLILYFFFILFFPVIELPTAEFSALSELSSSTRNSSFAFLEILEKRTSHFSEMLEAIPENLLRCLRSSFSSASLSLLVFLF